MSKEACTAKTTDKDTSSKEHMAVVSAYALCILIGSFYVIAQLLRFVCLVLHYLSSCLLSCPGSSVGKSTLAGVLCHGFESHPGQLFFFAQRCKEFFALPLPRVLVDANTATPTI